ncbi:Hypothetical predicted protein [Mytilus galloprovincialis]|uniref:Uncharacterized protein n=1 Tax=Mytilus galloprovincialis TaxID=29158 RepID=A0A8B6EEI6_MYTGA|nr:Hypothetical predicted protein [Mytilus galloprovincialis]
MINAPDCDPELKKVVYGAIIRNTGNEDPFDTVQAVLPVNPENEPGSTNVQPESPAETENPPIQQITDSVNNLNICDKKQKKKEKKKIKKKTKKFIKGLSKEQLMERNLNANIATHEKLYLYRQKVIHATKCTPDYSDEETVCFSSLSNSDNVSTLQSIESAYGLQSVPVNHVQITDSLVLNFEEFHKILMEKLS